MRRLSVVQRTAGPHGGSAGLDPLDAPAARLFARRLSDLVGGTITGSSRVGVVGDRRAADRDRRDDDPARFPRRPSGRARRRGSGRMGNRCDRGRYTSNRSCCGWRGVTSGSASPRAIPSPGSSSLLAWASHGRSASEARSQATRFPSPPCVRLSRKFSLKTPSIA